MKASGLLFTNKEAAFVGEQTKTMILCELPMKRIGEYTVAYSQSSDLYASLIETEQTKYAIDDLVLTI